MRKYNFYSKFILFIKKKKTSNTATSQEAIRLSQEDSAKKKRKKKEGIQDYSQKNFAKRDNLFWEVSFSLKNLFILDDQNLKAFVKVNSERTTRSGTSEFGIFTSNNRLAFGCNRKKR